MKRKLIIATGLVLLITLVGLAGCQSGSASLGEITGLNISSQQQGIWVTGQGKVTAVPDIAILRLGIEAQADSVAVAQSEAAEAMDKVMSSLTDNGIAEKDIQTQSFSIRQITKWDRTSEEEVVTGYRVTNIVSAKIRDVDSAGAVIDSVAAAGGDLTRIDSISFSVEDPTDYYEEAREEAMQDASTKAKQLASLAGVSLGNPTYISESFYSPSSVQRGGFEMMEEAAIIVETAISPGELEIIINLQVTYAIR